MKPRREVDKRRLGRVRLNWNGRSFYYLRDSKRLTKVDIARICLALLAEVEDGYGSAKFDHVATLRAVMV